MNKKRLDLIRWNYENGNPLKKWKYRVQSRLKPVCARKSSLLTLEEVIELTDKIVGYPKSGSHLLSEAVYDQDVFNIPDTVADDIYEFSEQYGVSPIDATYEMGYESLFLKAEKLLMKTDASSNFSDIGHVLGKSTWRKYVGLYNDFFKNRPELIVKKVGNTKGTQYYRSDVIKVINWSQNKERIENLWFDKTAYIPKRRKDWNFSEEMSELERVLSEKKNRYLKVEERLNKSDFMQKVKNKRKESPRFQKLPIASIARLIDEERIPLEVYKDCFDENGYSIYDERGFLKEDKNEVHDLHLNEIKEKFADLFDLDAYASYLKEVESIGGNRTNRKLSYIKYNPIVFLKEEFRQQIIALEKEKFWGNPKGDLWRSMNINNYYRENEQYEKSTYYEENAYSDDHYLESNDPESSGIDVHTWIENLDEYYKNLGDDDPINWYL